MGDPAELIAIRHGQSLANLRIPEAEAAGRDVTGLPTQDADVPLTDLGRKQSEDLGDWLTEPDNFPSAVLCSPFARSRETYQRAVIRAGMAGHMLPMAKMDDRLRDRGMGVLQLITTTTMRRRFPQEYARRETLGPFRHRPPGGERFADVAGRVEALRGALRLGVPDQRIVLITHDAVILSLRAAIDGLAEDDLTDIPLVPNGSITRWVRGDDGHLRLHSYGETGHLAPA